MKEDLGKLYLKAVEQLKIWPQEHLLGLFIFNLLLMLQILLYSAGYFTPFFKISINFIVLVSLLLSIVLLNLRSRAAFVLALLFWIFAAMLRVLNINVWAERAAVYFYEALIVGVVLFIMETVNPFLKGKPK